MKAEIIAVGSEILIGDICNTHSQFISKELANFGIDVLWHTSVGDNEERLKELISLAFERSDMVVFTGGLGPTKDDLTKEIVSEALGLELVKDNDTETRIKQYFNKMGRQMPSSNYKQAMVPKGSVVFQNNNGTAPGVAVQKDEKIAVLLPGPKTELEPMFEKQVRPFLEELTDSKIISHNINVFGMGESKVDEVLEDLLKGSNPSVGLYVKDGEVRIRVTAKAKDETQCEKLLEPVLNDINSRLSKYIYGTDIETLEKALVLELTKAGKKIATAESCTGGMIASKITSVSGASECFKCTVVSYSNDIKRDVLEVNEDDLNQYGAVSSQVAKQMAQGVRSLAKADIGISTTGIAGPGGGNAEKPVGLVYVAVASEKDTQVFRLMLSKGLENERDSIRNRASMFALDAARRILGEETSSL